MSARATYRKPRLLPDAQEFLSDLATLRTMIAELSSRYADLEETRRASDAAYASSPRDVAALCGDMSARERESLRVILLNQKNRVIDVEDLYHGTLNSSTVRVAEIFRAAIVANAASIIIVHNHPSGDPCPSLEDVRMTAECVKAGQLLDIAVLDHVIIGQDSQFVSLKERSLGF